MTFVGAWPFDGDLRRDNAALIVIDMQIDFCAPDGWVDQLGESIENTRKPIATISRLLAAAREAGLTIIHTREGHRPDLSDLNPNKRWRTRVHGLGVGDMGRCGRILTRGEPGHEIVPELAPLSGEIIVDKPGKGSFHATDLDQILRARGLRNLIIAGVTSDCCVQSTYRDAADLGYDCILASDATAAVQSDNHEGFLKILASRGGRWGALAPSDAIIEGLRRIA